MLKSIPIGFFALSTFLLNCAYGQSNVKEASYKYGDVALNKFLNKQFHEEIKKNNIPSCITSAVFAKFTIDSAGNIKNISFTDINYNPVVFKNILKSVILATNGSWVPRIINGKPVESKPFVLPLIYELEAGCNPKDLTINPKPHKEIPNGLATDLIYILRFDDDNGKNTTQLDCVLLEPLHIVSAN